MANKKANVIVPEERIVKRILLIRGEKVILDIHLAELYGVETRVLKQAVKRNIKRFPNDFMYELEEDEVQLVVSQNVIPHKKYFGGAKPFAFTETGVAMLSSVLKSEKAVEVNVAIMRTFVALRKIAISHDEIMRKLEQMKLEYNEKFADIFKALDYLFNPPELKVEKRKRIGFKGDQ
jgi:hypothetical protein